MLPDCTSIQATHSGQLPLHPLFSAKAKTAHVLDGITNASLISIGLLCDDDCIAVLNKQLIWVFKDQQCILRGKRNNTDGLWDIAIPTTSAPLPRTLPSSLHLNAIIRKDLSKTQLV
jgi:hypothetical protein